MQSVILFFVTMITVLIIDLIWLGYVAKDLYADSLGMFLRKSGNTMAPIWSAAMIVYICIALGIVYFVLPKANGNYFQALIVGIIFGAITYGIYDFTNYSLIANWPYKITIIDFLWGMVLCGSSSVVVTFIQNKFLN